MESKTTRSDGTGRDRPAVELISELIMPHPGSFNATRMGRGEPGLPTGFSWRDVSYEIVEELAAWKESSREGARAGGDVYLRRHNYKLRMSDGSTWSVYFVRQTPRTGNPKNRWFLYTLERDETESVN